MKTNTRSFFVLVNKPHTPPALMARARRRTRARPRRTRRRFKRRGRGRPRRRRRFRPRTTLIRQPVITDQTLVKLKYRQTIFLDIVSSGFQTASFRANSIFDPGGAGGTTQPMGHDQWATLYNKYQVLGCKMSARYSAAEALETAVELCLLAHTQSTSGFSGIRQMSEQTGAMTKLVPARSTALGSFRAYRSSAKLFQISGSMSTEHDTIADFGANPTEQWFFTFGGNTVASNPNLTRVVFQIQMTLYVRMLDRIILARS